MGCGISQRGPTVVEASVVLHRRVAFHFNPVSRVNQKTPNRQGSYYSYILQLRTMVIRCNHIL